MCRNGVDKMENSKLTVIPEFTAEQFYNTSQPYEFLYKFKDDKFLLGQMREKVKAQAA